MRHTLQGRIIFRYKRGECFHDSRAGVICGVGKDWVDIVVKNLGEDRQDVYEDYQQTLRSERPKALTGRRGGQ